MRKIILGSVLLTTVFMTNNSFASGSIENALSFFSETSENDICTRSDELIRVLPTKDKEWVWNLVKDPSDQNILKILEQQGESLREKLEEIVNIVAHIDFNDLLYTEGAVGVQQGHQSAIEMLPNFTTHSLIGSDLSYIIGKIYRCPERLQNYIQEKVDEFLRPESSLNSNFVSNLLSIYGLPLDFVNSLRRKFIESKKLDQYSFTKALQQILWQTDQEFKDETVERIAHLFPTMNAGDLAFLIQQIFMASPEHLQDQISLHILQKDINHFSESEFQYSPHWLWSTILYNKNPIHQRELKDLAIRLSEKDYFFLDMKMSLLQLAYSYEDDESDQKRYILSKMRKCLSQATQSLTSRINGFYFAYKPQSRLFPYDDIFSQIFAKMLDFEYKMSGGNAIISAIHNPISLSFTDLLLQKLLDEESSERWRLSRDEDMEMLSQIEHLIDTLSEDIQLTLKVASEINQEDNYIDAARSRIQIMRQARDENTDQWVGTATKKEISVPDHFVSDSGERLITQGRALQLVYDAMLKHGLSSIPSQHTLISLVQILGSNQVMEGCKEGAIGGMLRTTTPLHNQEQTIASARFDQHDLLLDQLKQFKSLMVYLLDQWKANENIFSDPILPELFSPGFIEIINTHPLIKQFFKILGHLKAHERDILLQDLQEKSVYALFTEVRLSEKEQEILEDLNTLFIVPAIKTFMHAQYKPFLSDPNLKWKEMIDQVKYISIVKIF